MDKMKYLYVLISFVLILLFNVPIVKASPINPNDFQIVINDDGSGKTTYQIVTIKVRHDYSGGNAGWDCLPDYSNGSSAGIEINNTGQKSYQYLGDGECIDGWSNIKWDITGFDGNVLYGLKTIYFQLSEAGGGSNWTTRSIVYEKPTPTPTPIPTSNPIPTPKPSVTKKTITTQKTTTPTTTPTITSNTNNLESVEPTATPIDKIAINVLGETTEKSGHPVYLIIIAVLGIIVIGLVIFIIRGKRRLK